MFCPAIVQAVLGSIPLSAQIIGFAVFAGINVDIVALTCDGIAGVSSNLSISLVQGKAIMEPNGQSGAPRSVITAMAYSPDSRYVAVGGMNIYNEGDDMDDFQETQLHIVEAQTGVVIRTLYKDADEPRVFPYFHNIV